MGGGTGGIGGFSGGHAGGMTVRRYGVDAWGYQEDWMARTKETLEKELRYRGIESAVIAEVVDKIEEPSIAGPVWIAILATALVLSMVFFVIWENT